jgi:hypothetical protein
MASFALLATETPVVNMSPAVKVPEGEVTIAIPFSALMLCGEGIAPTKATAPAVVIE